MEEQLTEHERILFTDALNGDEGQLAKLTYTITQKAYEKGFRSGVKYVLNDNAYHWITCTVGRSVLLRSDNFEGFVLGFGDKVGTVCGIYSTHIKWWATLLDENKMVEDYGN